MLNGPFSTKGTISASLLRKPHSGAMSMIQPSVVATLGKMYAIQNMNSSLWVCGMLVRASTRLIATAVGKLMERTEAQMMNELRSDSKMPGVDHAWVQFVSPN